LGNLRVVTTAKSGYIQRKIVKVCEDIQIQYDQTVRDATGKIYQFSYGENGYDSTKTIRVNNEPNPCDISRLADRLNTSFELGINEESDPDEYTPKISSTILEDGQHRSLSTSSEKKKLISKIKKKNPKTVVNEDWNTDELSQRLESLDIEEDSEDYENDDDEVEDEDEEGDEEEDEEGDEEGDEEEGDEEGDEDEEGDDEEDDDYEEDNYEQEEMDFNDD